MSWGKRFRGSFAWSLIAAFVIVFKDDWRRLGFALLLGVVGAALQSLLDTAQVRWSTPLRWPWKRQSHKDGTA